MGGASMTYQVTDKMVNTFAQAMLLSMPEVTDHYDQVKFGLEAVFKELETTCTQDGGYCGIGGFRNKTEVDELKAQVNALREELKMLNIGLSFSLCHGDGVIKRSDIKKLISDVDKELEATPEQCLAEVKAKAIEDACADLKKELKRLDSYALADSATITDQAKRIKYLEMVVSMCHTMDTVEDIPILETYTAPIALRYSLESDFNAPEEINLWYGVGND